MKVGACGFWSKGRRQYVKALREQEKQRVALLEAELRSAGDRSGRQRLQAEIKSIRADFRKRRKEADSGLYIKP